MNRLLLLFAACIGLLAPPGTVRAATNRAGTVYVIPIRGMIEPALVYVIRRGLAEAQVAGAEAIVFTMDTPGGTLDAASQIVRTIQKVTVPTYTFVEKDAFSAGAIIALATDRIYMAPGSVIGDAMPIMMSPLGGGPLEMPDDVQEKMVSGVAALIRSAAQESGHDPQLAEKMVRRDGEYRLGDDVIAPTNRLLTLTNVEAERAVVRGGKEQPLLSAGTVKDLDELLERIGRANAAQKELLVTNAEKIARFIAALAPLFLMAGLLGIYIEIKSPGIGLPGILGAIALALFFWGHHIAGLAGMEEVVIFVVGVVLILVEVFLFPTVGILGLIGGALMLLALLLAMIQQFPGAPAMPTLPEFQLPLTNLALAIVLAAVFVALFGRFLPKTTAFNRVALAASTSRAAGYTAVPDFKDMIGQTGTAVSALRPSGTAEFGDRRLDVITRGAFVAAGARVRVVEAQAGAVVVEEMPS